MDNWDSSAASEYHQRSKLWPGAGAPRSVAPELVPRPYKLYAADLPTVELPEPFPGAVAGALPAILGEGLTGSGGPFGLATIAALLRLSAGIVRRRVINGREVAFRAASCTGGAYHVEAYLVCGDLPGLAAGVYHYGVHDDRLRLLRAGDHRGALSHATGEDAAVVPEASVVLTSVFWRNAWRYEERAYRHVFWDSGTILANLLAVATDRGVETRVRTGFVDAAVNALVDIHSDYEAAVAVVQLGRRVEGVLVAPIVPLGVPEVPSSAASIEYPAINRMHEASSLADVGEVGRYRAAEPVPVTTRGALSADGGQLDAVIRARGSTRRFAVDAITQAELTVLVAAARSGIPLDADNIAGRIELAVIVHAVRGMEPGLYRWQAGELAMERLGDLRGEAAHLALDQEPAGTAAVNLYFWCRLPDVLERYGNCGYRAAQLAAAIAGGRVYLAAHALGLGATGLTFYDDEVAAALGQPPEQTAVLFLVACGRR